GEVAESIGAVGQPAVHTGATAPAHVGLAVAVDVRELDRPPVGLRAVPGAGVGEVGDPQGDRAKTVDAIGDAAVDAVAGAPAHVGLAVTVDVGELDRSP